LDHGRFFTNNGVEVQPSERWIGCDLLRSHKDFGWGDKDLDESIGPYFSSCPLKYLDLVRGSAATPVAGSNTERHGPTPERTVERGMFSSDG